MKVFMINTVCGSGSTGRICTEIAAVLRANGHKCIIGYGQGKTNYANSYKIGGTLENHLHNIGSRVLGKQGYFTKNGTENLIEKIKLENPDVIHLHNLHGNYLHLETIFNFLQNYTGKIVWTLHDCWAFTGKCSHYTDVECYKWRTECRKCPQVKEYPPSIFLDRSRELFRDKEKWYNTLKIDVVAVSGWLKGDVEKSVLLGGKNIHMIYNWVNHDIFKSGKINTGKKKKILLVSAFWNEGSAKIRRLLSFCNTLQDKYEIIVLGKISEVNKKMLVNVSFVEHVQSIEKMADYYSEADVYVHLSTEDTFGLVIAEAMSCGTPVVAFDSSACAEIVGDKSCGKIINKKESIERATEEILANGKESYSQNCRSRVVQNFDLKKNIAKYIELYFK